MKPRLLQAYMRTAETFAELSHARRLHVGAIVVKDDRIISIGYNGMPAGWDNNCEDEVVDSFAGFEGAIHNTRLRTKPEVLHAERNALDKLAKGNEGGLGSTMFITHAPCLECAKSIYGAGIRQVFYGEEYRSTDGVEFLKKCLVNVEQVK
jgi:dCMP deaminase